MRVTFKIAVITEEKMELEKLHLGHVDSMDIIDYIKQSVEILMSMREDEFNNFNKNWKMQERLREIRKEKVEEPDLFVKNYRTPKNSRFFAKIKQQTEMLTTPKTNRKLRTREEQTIKGGGREPDSDELIPFEYE